MSKWNVNSRLALFTILCITTPVSTFGQSGCKGGGGLGVTTTSVKSTPANTQGISTRGYGFQVIGSLPLYNVFAIRLDWGAEYFGDKKPFTQQTTGGEARSAVIMFYGSIALGIFMPRIHCDKTPKGIPLTIGVNVGTDWVGGQRWIRAFGGRSEGVDLRGGPYLEPELQLNLSGGCGLGVSYRYYNYQSDLQNRLILKGICIE